jgi:hypothetical protein
MALKLLKLLVISLVTWIVVRPPMRREGGSRGA